MGTLTPLPLRGEVRESSLSREAARRRCNGLSARVRRKVINGWGEGVSGAWGDRSGG